MFWWGGRRCVGIGLVGVGWWFKGGFDWKINGVVGSGVFEVEGIRSGLWEGGMGFWFRVVGDSSWDDEKGDLEIGLKEEFFFWCGEWGGNGCFFVLECSFG